MQARQGLPIFEDTASKVCVASEKDNTTGEIITEQCCRLQPEMTSPFMKKSFFIYVDR